MAHQPTTKVMRAIAHFLAVICVLGMVALCAPAWSEPSYDAVLLFPPGGKSGNIYNAVNAGGTMLGVHGNWNGGASDANARMPYQPALYANGKLTPLGKTLGGATTVAYSINASGHIAGCSDDANNASHAFLYAAGRMQDLGTLKHARSCATAVNDRDEVVGNLSDPSDAKAPESHAFLYRNGTMRDLNDAIPLDGTLFNGAKYVLNSASAINNRGDILLQAKTADGQSAMLVYADGKLAMPDPAFQAAHRLSPGGYGRLGTQHEFVATEWNKDYSEAHAYVFRSGRFEPLIAPQAGVNLELYGRNAAGAMIGVASQHGNGPRLTNAYAFVTADGKIVDLNSAVDSAQLKVDGKQYVLKCATGINDAGVIVGDASQLGETALGAVFVLTPRAPGTHLDAAAMGKTLQEQGAVEIYDILFDSGKTSIKPASRATLEQIAKLLKSDASLKLEVSGHTDNQGNAARNLALSKHRAAAVVQALVGQYGIAAARLQAQGYGDTKPVAPNGEETGRAKNRRVELRKID